MFGSFCDSLRFCSVHVFTKYESFCAYLNPDRIQLHGFILSPFLVIEEYECEGIVFILWVFVYVM